MYQSCLSWVQSRTHLDARELFPLLPAALGQGRAACPALTQQQRLQRRWKWCPSVLQGLGPRSELVETPGRLLSGSQLRNMFTASQGESRKKYSPTDAFHAPHTDDSIFPLLQDQHEDAAGPTCSPMAPWSLLAPGHQQGPPPRH